MPEGPWFSWPLVVGEKGREEVFPDGKDLLDRGREEARPRFVFWLGCLLHKLRGLTIQFLGLIQWIKENKVTKMLLIVTPWIQKKEICLQTPLFGWLWTHLDLRNIFWGDSDPWGQILGPRTFWPQIQKSALFSQNPTIWNRLDPSNHFWGNLDPLGQIYGPRAFWPQFQKSAIFS